MSKYYVGKGKGRGEVFKCDHTPTAEEFPQYGYCTGPFVTLRAAKWASQYGATFHSIAEAERLALAEYQKTRREEAEFTRQAIRQAWATNTLD